jgi:hypothetical protein
MIGASPMTIRLLICFITVSYRDLTASTLLINNIQYSVVHYHITELKSREKEHTEKVQLSLEKERNLIRERFFYDAGGADSKCTTR